MTSNQPKNRHNIFGSVFSKSTLRTMIIAFLTAAVGALGGAIVQSEWPAIWAKLRPSPYAYLEGTYKGTWNWTDPVTQAPTNTVDTVYFESTANAILVGRGTDTNLGTYTFKGNLDNNHVNAAYLSDVGSGEPAQSGGFDLYVASKDPLILTGTWTGFMNTREIKGTAKLVKQSDTQTP
jgi:hypothetical protein